MSFSVRRALGVPASLEKDNMDNMSYHSHDTLGALSEEEAMTTQVPQVDELPRRPATQVKNGWGELMRQVRSSGTVAVTSYDQVEVIVMDVRQYQQIAQLVAGVMSNRETALAELSADFDRRLAKLQDQDTGDRIDAVMASRGRTPTRPKAGSSY
jgi:hypothetical protein